jgi:hypothetical protein
VVEDSAAVVTEDVVLEPTAIPLEADVPLVTVPETKTLSELDEDALVKEFQEVHHASCALLRCMSAQSKGSARHAQTS